MKKVMVIAGMVWMVIIISCTNEKWSFPDFDYTTTYFPYQFPVRTLVLGDYYFDNSGDNLLKFSIGAHMGGVYKNKQDIKIGIAVDTTLAGHLHNSVGNAKIEALPSAYYTSPLPSEMTIAKGAEFGMVDVQLTQAFLDDTLAIAPKNITYYVIPLKMTSSTTDSILSGLTINPSADPRVISLWVKPPKNFTLYGIKYVNQYHGKYLIRGASAIKAQDGSTTETIVYRSKYVEQNSVVAVNSYRKNAVTFSNAVKRTGGTDAGYENFEMKIAFGEDGTGTIQSTTRYPLVKVSGNAKFVKGADEWGGQKRDVIYLDYQFQAADKNTHALQNYAVKDTLVFRDKGISFEEFIPKITQ